MKRERGALHFLRATPALLFLKLMIVLGIDPSLTSTGMALLEVGKGKPRLIDWRSLPTKPKQSMPERLEFIAAGVENFARDYEANRAGVETGIVYRGRKTTLMLAQVRGVVLQALHAAGVEEIIDLNNATAKKSVGASKEDGKPGIHRGIRKRVRGVASADPPLNDDEADAVAIAFAVSKGLGKPA